jgi:hypothetical protein
MMARWGGVGYDTGIDVTIVDSHHHQAALYPQTTFFAGLLVSGQASLLIRFHAFDTGHNHHQPALLSAQSNCVGVAHVTVLQSRPSTNLLCSHLLTQMEVVAWVNNNWQTQWTSGYATPDVGRFEVQVSDILGASGPHSYCEVQGCRRIHTFFIST